MRWRNRHAAVVQFVENQIQAITTDDDEEAVTNQVIKDVNNKFQAASPMFDTFVRRMTKVVIHKHRRQVDEDGAEVQLDVICEEFQMDIQAVAVSSSNASSHGMPQNQVALASNDGASMVNVDNVKPNMQLILNGSLPAVLESFNTESVKVNTFNQIMEFATKEQVRQMKMDEHERTIQLETLKHNQSDKMVALEEKKLDVEEKKLEVEEKKLNVALEEKKLQVALEEKKLELAIADKKLEVERLRAGSEVLRVQGEPPTSDPTPSVDTISVPALASIPVVPPAGPPQAKRPKKEKVAKPTGKYGSTGVLKILETPVELSLLLRAANREYQGTGW